MRSFLSRILPNCPFDCKRGCMRCIGPLTELQNLIIYVTSKEWEHRVAKYLAQAPERGHKMIIHHHDARILCRIVEVRETFFTCFTSLLDHAAWHQTWQVKLVDDESDAALYTVRWPPNTSDLKPGEKMEIREGVRRKYLEFRRPRFPRRWEEWLVKKLNLVEGGVAEVLKSLFACWLYKPNGGSHFFLFARDSLAKRDYARPNEEPTRCFDVWHYQ